MSDGDFESESQEEILAALMASFTDEDVPPEEDAYGWPDPDTGMPVELLGLTDQELYELDEAAQPQPAPRPRPCPSPAGR